MEKKVIAYQPTIEKVSTCVHVELVVGGGWPSPLTPHVAAQVELNKAEVRWIRPNERLTGVAPEDGQTEDLYRKFQGILNKLTPQMFQSLAEQALKLEINTEQRLSGCIDKIFTKVCLFGCVTGWL